MSKLLLIDGHSILTRAFFGIPDLTNSEGLHTNAVYGFLNIMFKILEEEKPQNMMVAFDVKAPTFRHKMYEAYKGTRKPMPNELHEQVPLIKEVLKAMNIVVMEKAGYEADDILGTVAKDAVKKGYDVVIVSGDRDLLQLAEDKILIRIPKTKKGTTEIENYYANDVYETYQVTPDEFIDLKALMGDTADNIPGVKSIGEKTATKLITQYHTIENLYDNIENVTPERVKNALITGRDDAFLSKDLATINITAPIDIFVEDGPIKDMFNEESYKLVRRLEFKNMLSKFDSSMKETVQKIDFEKLLNMIDTKEQLSAVCEKALNYANKQSDCQNYIGISVNIFEEIGILAGTIAIENEIFYIENSETLTKQDITDTIKLLSSNCKVAIFDLKSALHKIDVFDINDDILDCKIASYLLNPLKDNYNYSDVAREFLSMELETSDEILGKMSVFQLYTIDRHKYIMLTSSEAYVASHASKAMVEALKETDMLMLYKNIEYPVIYVLYEMEKNGILVDGEDLRAYSKELSGMIEMLEKDIYKETGEEFNINSPKQLGELLFGKMGIPGGKKTKTGYSTSADVLEKLAPTYPVVNKILEYRQLTKLKSTYADGLAAYIDYDGRIHGTFNQTITATGRISSTEPNLQNIPIRMEMGKRFRKVFIPKEDYVFIDADYSQIELRILAHMSDDNNLIEAYNSEQDIHKITAAQVFHLDLDDVTPEIRSKAKAVNFGVVYGISSFGLSQDLNISKKEASEFIKKYYETFPKVKEFLDETVELAKNQGYTATIYGRRRPIPELKSSNFMQRAFGERAAMNSAIQGTAADIMKLAMIKVYKELKDRGLKSRLLLQVHDEILIETHKDEIDIVKNLVTDAMMNAANLKVCLEIGLEVGENWLQAH